MELSARVIVSVFNDIRQEHATGEALLRARQVDPNLLCTLWFSKVTLPSIIFHADMDLSTVDVQKCKQKSIILCRDIATFSSDTDYQTDYRDKDSWEFHVFDNEPRIGIDNYSLITTNFLSKLGLKSKIRNFNDVTVNGKVIGCTTYTWGKFFWWNSSLFQDLPNIDEFYVKPVFARFTSLKRELSRIVSDEEIISGIKESFCSRYNCSLVEGDLTKTEKELFKDALQKYYDEKFISEKVDVKKYRIF